MLRRLENNKIIIQRLIKLEFDLKAVIRNELLLILLRPIKVNRRIDGLVQQVYARDRKPTRYTVVKQS